MIFKTRQIIFLLAFIPFAGMTQSIKKANELYETRSYVKAIEIYKKLPATRESLLKLGDCYYYNLDVRNAAKIYETLYETYPDSLPNEFYFRYADALKGIKQYYKSDEIATAHLGDTTNTETFRELLKGVVPYTYETERLKTFNQTVAFGPFVYKDELIFASPAQKTSKKYKWNDQPYLDLFKGTLTEEHTLDSIIPYSDALNSKTHESSIAITKNGQTLYFSRTAPDRTNIDGIKVATVKIYKAQWTNGDWDQIEPLNISGDSYSVQHPVLSPEEDRLYFSSDMPGSEGSFDIYYVDLNADGSVAGTPVNLGPEINTPHREQFPFVDADGSLYFSSNGHAGFGGLDIFYSKFESNSYLAPLNLGEELNSSRDDFAYTGGRTEDEGFFSSNRDGVDQIYRFVRSSKEREYLIQGLVVDANTKEILPDTEVTLYDANGTIIGSVMTNEEGRYELPTKPNNSYRLEAYRPLYVVSSEPFDTNDSGDITFNIELEIESYDDAEDIVIEKEDGYTYIELENIYFDLDRWEIKAQAAKTLDILVDLLKKYPRMEIELGAHTDSRASPSYNMVLSQKRADAAMKYISSKGIAMGRVLAKGYGETRPLVDCGNNCTDMQFAINRRCEFIIIK